MKKSAIIFALATSISGITVINAQEANADARRTQQEQEVYEKSILPNPPRPATSPDADLRMDPAETTAPAVNWKPAPTGPDREEVAPVNTLPGAPVTNQKPSGKIQPLPAEPGVLDDRRRMNTTRAQTLPSSTAPVQSHRDRNRSAEQPEGVKPR